MLISIITPTFNSATTLSITLNSVSAQSYKHIEHIVIDGGSKDNTLNIIKSYPHIRQIISESDQGPYDAMNKGIKMATGEVIGILNADDYYLHREVIEQVMKKFESQDVDALYGDLNYVDQFHPTRIVRKWKSGPYHKNLFLRGWMPPHPTFFIRKKFYEKYGAYHTDFTISADYELMLRMLYKHQISCVYLPEILIAMRTGGKSNHSWQSRWLANQEDRKAWKINGLKPGLLTLWMKPLSKIAQFF